MPATLEDVVRIALDHAQGVWREHGKALVERSEKVAKAEAAPSFIPGHPFVREGEITVGPFIALVADMRKSSEHLLQARKNPPSQIERVYYETSGLLPGLAWAISQRGGSVTEYLGDGVLALFDASKQPKCIYDSYNAARDCITSVRTVVNAELDSRFGLEPVALGIGLAYSKCVVHLVGLENARHPKAIGQCVYHATKLSDGWNEIWADSALEVMWPKEKGAPLHFKRAKRNNLDAFLIEEHTDQESA
jgi:hypothetical protein